MKKIICSLISVVLFSLTSFAQEKFPDYKAGEGAQYSMTVDGQPAEVKMAFVQRLDHILVIEMEMKMEASKLGMPIHMVQQFHLTLEAGKIKIAKGFMKIPNIPKPQELPADFLKGYDGAQMSSFLIDSKADIDASKVGEMKMQTAQGMVNAIHYSRTSNGQTVDFWITDDPKLKPMSMVMMKSKGKKKEQNYTVKYTGPVKGYKAKINASNAEPLSPIGRMFLPVLSNTSTFLN